MQENNKITVDGEITSGFEYDHDCHGEGFYRVYIAIPRLSGEYDQIPCVVSERLVDVTLNYKGCPVRIKGQYRSLNRHMGGRSKLDLFIFAREFEFLEILPSMCWNRVMLQGFICKPPVYRKTPSGREIGDILLAVNRQYGKTDYIPIICWGRDATFCTVLAVGDMVYVSGRVQSRKYLKNNELRTAYEVSASEVNLLVQGTQI